MRIAELIRHHGSDRCLHLADTFAGMPDSDLGCDLHSTGDFAASDLEHVRWHVGVDDFISHHSWFTLATIASCGTDRIAFAQIDLDVRRSIAKTCAFLYPSLLPGAVMVFDDYGFMSCPGAQQAVDAFCAGEAEVQLVLPIGQAVVFHCGGGEA